MALIYTSIELTCGTLIIEIKNSICAYLIVLRAFIYASNESLCGTLIINLRTKINLCMLLQANKNMQIKNQIKKEYKISINNLSMNNFHISAKAAAIKILRF